MAPSSIPPPMATTKRTRSQTTLDSFFTNRLDLAASPLKQARNALKHPPTTLPHHPDPEPSPPPLPDPHRATATPSPDNFLKRPSSPTKDAALLAQRGSKRLRHEALFPNLPTRLNDSIPTLPASPDRRAKSVPPRSLSPTSDNLVPLLDLNNVPSSPRRSPAKFRIASLPPESPSKHIHLHLHHRPSSFPNLPPKSPSPFLPLPPLPLIPDPILSAGHAAALSVPTTPMSPLTPLPQDDSMLPDITPDLDATPVPKPIHPPPLSLEPLPGPSSLPPPHGQSPSATPTRPSSVFPSLLPSSTNPPQSQSMLPRSSGVKSRMKPKAPGSPDVSSKKVKNPRNRKPPTLGPPQIRNTRSTRAHREKSLAPVVHAKEAQQAEKGVDDAFTAILSSPRPTSRLSNTQHTNTQPSQSRPTSSSSQPILPRSKLPQPKTPRASASQLPQPLQMPHASRPAQPSAQSLTIYHDTTERLRDEPPVTPANGRRRSQSFSYTRPTSSSVAKATPVKPTLPLRATSRPPSTSTSNSTPSAHTSAPLQVPETGGKNKPAGPFDFKSIRATTPTAPAAEATTVVNGASENINGSRVPFAERPKTPVGVREKTPVTISNPKVKGKKRARSVDPAVFTRAKTPVGAEVVVKVAPPQGSDRLTSVDDGTIVQADRVEKVLNGGEDDVATPRQGRKQVSPVPVADGGPTPLTEHAQADEVDFAAAVELGVFAESDHPAVDADGDTTMLPPPPSTHAQPDVQPSEDSELSELSELEDSSAAEQTSLKGSGWESESDVPDDVAPRPGPSVPRRPPTSGTAALNSSLSTLSQALERLNAPVPSRPNTSLGFHRSVSSDGNDSFSSEPGTSDPATGEKRTNSNSKAYGRARSVVPNAVATAKGKGKAVPKPMVNGRASTSATTATATATGQKKLKQTTLMLPPPPPITGTRTTRLRSAALAAANASVPGTPGSSAATVNGKTPKDQEKAKQVSLALAPSLGKVRAGLANFSGQTSSGSTSAIPSLLGLPRTGLAVPPAKRAFLSSGAGAERGGSSSLAKPLFGVGKLNVASGSGAPTRGGFGLAALRGRGGGSRVTHRASKVSSLPMVVGSPVKDGAIGDEDAANGAGVPSDDEMVVVEEKEEGMEGVQEMSTKDKIDEWLRTADKDILRDLGHGSDGEDGEAGAEKSVGALSLGDLGPVDAEASAKEKEKEREARRNASRRASMASHLLAQSLSALPSATPPAARGKDAKGKGRAVSSSYPSGAALARDQEDGGDAEKMKIDAPTPPPRRAHATRLATGALSTPPNAYKERSLRSAVAGGSGLGDVEHPSGGSADGKGKGKGKTDGPNSPAALAVLKDCRIFVDVRTEDGDDAGSLFVDMLRDLGAKILTRVGSRCTHVVFKNGLQSTLKSYRMRSDPKPHVVGIAWVVECAEQQRKVEEARFAVNLNLMNVAGGNKRRKSMLPKNFSSPVANKTATSPPSSDSYALNTSLGAASRSGNGANDSLDLSSSMTMDEDGDISLPMLNPSSGGGADEEESLPPLEMARRRRLGSMMPT